MNPESPSNVLRNVNVFRFLGYLLVFLMMACAVMSLGMLIQNVLPGWHSGIIAGILSFIVIDRLYTYRGMRSLIPLSSEWAIAILSQWLLILLVMRFLLSYADGLDSLRADLALFAREPTTLTGIASWRVKETDRIAAMAAELRKLGARVEAGRHDL